MYSFKYKFELLFCYLYCFLISELTCSLTLLILNLNFVSNSTISIMAQANPPAANRLFPDLRQCTLDRVFHETRDEITTIQFSQQNGLIRTTPNCAYCRRPTQIKLKRDLHGPGPQNGQTFRFRCGKDDCRKEIAVKSESFIEDSRLSISVIVRFIYFWAFELLDQEGY